MTRFFMVLFVLFTITSCCPPCEVGDLECEEEIETEEEATCSVYLSYEGYNDDYYLCIRGIPEACAITFSRHPTDWQELSRCGEDNEEVGHCERLNDVPDYQRARIYSSLNIEIDLSSCGFNPREMLWWDEEDRAIQIDLTP